MANTLRSKGGGGGGVNVWGHARRVWGDMEWEGTGGESIPHMCSSTV